MLVALEAEPLDGEIPPGRRFRIRLDTLALPPEQRGSLRWQALRCAGLRYDADAGGYVPRERDRDYDRVVTTSRPRTAYRLSIWARHPPVDEEWRWRDGEMTIAQLALIGICYTLACFWGFDGPDAG